jgi:ATP-dependent helicase/nuclease subunit A
MTATVPPIVGPHGRADVPLETKGFQRSASDPRHSAWVSANAGSGKTWVLSRRVIRLLLAGTPASKILCLTYTKAAAATMSNRVFAELARWTTLDDAALKREIAEIEGIGPGSGALRKARRLFAEAIETPGGLKIQTIHAFCEAILHQFPLEADLPGRFEILDDAGKADLLRASKRRTLLAATAEPETPLGGAFAAIIDLSGEYGYEQAIAEMLAERATFKRWLQNAGTFADVLAELRAALGLDASMSAQSARALMLQSPHVDRPYLVRLLDALLSGTSTDAKQAALLEIYLSDKPAGERLEAWRGFLFTAKGLRKKSIATKAIVERFPDLPDRFAAEADRMEALADQAASADSFAYTAAVLTLGDAVIGDYEREKRARGALDFDDLIERTVSLLDRSDSAAWVQFKLDKGIDHILVDEAQDTSPAMWTIVSRLAEEFFSGDTARAQKRTLFAVGDEKQSIYSFQGAAPDQFSQMRRTFAAKAHAAAADFADIKLSLSFRSTPDVLAAVDTVFVGETRAGVVADPDDYADHAALRAFAPGHVEIWPMLRDEKIDEPDDWADPLDKASPASSIVQLAGRVAREIKALLSGAALPGTGEPVRPRDILILVRSRHGFVGAVNRVLKDRGVPVAGADRLLLTSHIAVEDLVALGRVMLIAEDDLSLAIVLKSPLFGWDDGQLFRIADDRRDGHVSLWSKLVECARTDPAARLALEQLSAWRGRSDRIPPFEFYARVLGADGGRRRFIERLGSEADDVLDEFLAHALAQERAGSPGLAGFLAGLEAAEPAIKREMDETRDEVRVMTVHGAKGLEAPIVFLVDAGGPPSSPAHAPRTVNLAIPGRDPALETALCWVRSGRDRPKVIEAALEEARRRTEEEYRRLLYVAMTRAADRLYVCGFTRTRDPDEACWHQVIERSLVASGRAIERRTDAGEVEAYVWRSTDLAPISVRATELRTDATDAPPDWLLRRPPLPDLPVRLSPSRALEDMGLKEAREPVDGAATLDAVMRPQEAERVRGTLIHRLLEVLPDLATAERPRATYAFLERAGGALDADERQAIEAEVAAVLSDPDFAALFAPGSRAEVPIVGDVATRNGERYAVAGQIDRLAVTDHDVLILDYKTNRHPPREVPEAYAVQMALYAHLLRSIFPGRTIRAAILWTARPRIAEVPAAMLNKWAETLSLL